jgi:PAS domain-containing protein
MRTPDQSQHFLAILEAEVGSLLEMLPVPLLVTSECGDILRANAEACHLLDSARPLVGRHVEDVLRQQAISIRMRLLCDRGRAVRLYVLQDRSEHACSAGIYTLHRQR